MKFFQWQVDPTPHHSLVGGPRYAPSAARDPLRDTPAHANPERTAGKSGGVPFFREGLNVGLFVVLSKYFYIINFSSLFNRKIIIFIPCTGLSESEPFSFNCINFLNLVFILIYKHGFK